MWDAPACKDLPDNLKPVTTVPTLNAAPKIGSYVFAKAVEDCDPFTLPDTDTIVQLKKDDTVLLPYEPLAPLMFEGRVCLA